MDPSTSYAIIGCGAVGGYYGGCLHRAGAQTHFLARRDCEHIRRYGLVVQSKQGDFCLPQVNVYEEADRMPRCDVVIVALKTTHNHVLRQILPVVMKPNGVVLMLQNGLDNEAYAASIVNSGRVLGGLCFVCCQKVGPGHVRHLDYGQVHLGVFESNVADNAVNRRLASIIADFEHAGISVNKVADLQAARWQKLVWNIPYNGLSVLLDATTDQIMDDPDGRQLVRQLMEEVAMSAACCHHAVPEGTIDKMFERTARMVPYQTSMKIDYDAKRPMEVEAIFGNPVRAAGAVGVSVPQMQMMYQQLTFLDRRNLAGQDRSS